MQHIIHASFWFSCRYYAIHTGHPVLLRQWNLADWLAQNVAMMGEIWNAYKISVGKPLGKLCLEDQKEMGGNFEDGS